MRVPALVLAVWTFATWGTRVRNIAGDDDLGAGARAVALLVALAFVLGATAVIVALVRRSERFVLLASLLAAGTLVYWPVRLVQIATRDHSAAFVAVHVVLGVLGMLLAGWTLRARMARSRPGMLPVG
jgi:hypothetical protein